MDQRLKRNQKSGHFHCKVSLRPGSEGGSSLSSHGAERQGVFSASPAAKARGGPERQKLSNARGDDSSDRWCSATASKEEAEDGAGTPLYSGGDAGFLGSYHRIRIAANYVIYSNLMCHRI